VTEEGARRLEQDARGDARLPGLPPALGPTMRIGMAFPARNSWRWRRASWTPPA